MALGQIGSLTSAAEGMATAVGAGMLIGSFVLGSVGLLAGQSRRALEKRVLIDGYYGGLLGVTLVVLDLATHYAG